MTANPADAYRQAVDDCNRMRDDGTIRPANPVTREDAPVDSNEWQHTKRANRIHDELAACHPSLARGRVWCRECKATRLVDSADAFRHGWPKCCGFTMTIDSPSEATQEIQNLTGAPEDTPEEKRPVEMILAVEVWDLAHDDATRWR